MEIGIWQFCEYFAFEVPKAMWTSQLPDNRFLCTRAITTRMRRILDPAAVPMACKYRRRR